MVRRALRVSPYDERLYRALLRATEAQGNRVGLHRPWPSCSTLAGEARLPARPGTAGASTAGLPPSRDHGPLP